MLTYLLCRCTQGSAPPPRQMSRSRSTEWCFANLQHRVQVGRKLFRVGHEPLLDWTRSVVLAELATPEPINTPSHMPYKTFVNINRYN